MFSQPTQVADLPTAGHSTTTPKAILKPTRKLRDIRTRIQRFLTAFDDCLIALHFTVLGSFSVTTAAYLQLLEPPRERATFREVALPEVVVIVRRNQRQIASRHRAQHPVSFLGCG